MVLMMVGAFNVAYYFFLQHPPEEISVIGRKVLKNIRYQFLLVFLIRPSLFQRIKKKKKE